MYEFFIKNYINNKFCIEDVYSFASNNNISISKNESEVIYKYVKNYWQVFYKGNPEGLFKELKTLLSENTYNKAYELYLEYKKKYNWFYISFKFGLNVFVLIDSISSLYGGFSFMYGVSSILGMSSVLLL